MDIPTKTDHLVKKPYRVPQLVVYGDVEDLTKGSKERSMFKDGLFGGSGGVATIPGS